MITIKVDGYKKADKVVIAKDYLLPKIITEFGFDSQRLIVFSNDIIEKIIDSVDAENGVRNLKRGLVNIVSWINLYSYTKDISIEYPFVVTEDFVKKHIVQNSKDKSILHTMYT